MSSMFFWCMCAFVRLCVCVLKLFAISNFQFVINFGDCYAHARKHTNTHRLVHTLIQMNIILHEAFRGLQD